MKNINDVVVVAQARLNSERVPQKMIRPFAGSSLFDIGLKKLTESRIIPKENIFASVCEEELIKIANSHAVNIFKRSVESANNDNSLQKIYEWHDKLPYKYVVKVNLCSPLLSIETIDDFIEKFLWQESENLFGVIEQKDYFWNDKGKLITPWPIDQTIMNTKAVDITYKAAHVLYASRMDLISKNKFMGDFQKEGGISLHPIDELQCFDIDYEWQFKVAELIWENIEKS